MALLITADQQSIHLKKGKRYSQCISTTESVTSHNMESTEHVEREFQCESICIQS